ALSPAGESRFEALLQLATSFERVDGQRSRDHARHALRVADHLDDRRATGLAHLALARSCWTLTQFEDALDHAKSALAIFEELGAAPERAATHQTLGKIYIFQSRYTDAYLALAAAREDFHACGDLRGEASAVNDLGVALLRLGDFKTATRRLREAESILKQNAEPVLLARVYVNLGEVHVELDELDAAMNHLTAGHALFERLGVDQCGLAAAAHEIAEVHRKRGQLDDALEWHTKALEIRERVGHARGLASSWNAVGAVHTERGDLDTAADFLKRALQKANDFDLPLERVRAYRNFSALHEASGDFEQALIDYKRYHELHRAVYDDQRRTVMELEATRRHPESRGTIVRAVPGAPGVPGVSRNAMIDVLVIESDEFVRSVTVEMLEQDGMRVIAASDARTGLAAFRARAEAIDAVLLDLNPPDLTGAAALHEIRRLNPAVPVVLTSGRAREDATYGIRDHADFLQKPYDPDGLVASLRRAAARRTG
ncbi:MAG: tetratricopeptide repeat protein, partial [Gemmatimonadetes bacterium]|nr:tetratricopeptide repeat protein [Gemmatimonadota bacterium]